MFRRLADRFQDAVNSATMTTEQQHLATLRSMGFSEPDARRAYQACGGNVERAAEQLLTSGAANNNNNGSNGMAMDMTRQHQEDDDLQRALEASLQVGAQPTAEASASAPPMRSAASHKAGKAALNRFDAKNSKNNTKKTVATKRSTSPKPSATATTSITPPSSFGNPLIVPSHPGVKVPAKLSEKTKEEQILRTADRLKSYPAAVDTLYKALKGLQSNPNDPRFQQIDQSNAGYQKSLALAPGALDLLLAMNYRPHGLKTKTLVLEFCDPATLYLGISALEQVQGSTEYRHQKALLQLDKEIVRIQQMADSSVEEAIGRANFMSQCPSEPSVGRGSIMTIQITSDSSIHRRFDGDDTLQDVLNWLGGHGTEIYKKLVTTTTTSTEDKELPEWYLVDLHRSPPLPYANLESLAPKTLQYLGCWPSGKLAIQPRIVALAHNTSSGGPTKNGVGGSSRGLGAAATEHL